MWVKSCARACFRFSDVGEDDAPTRLSAGSHRAVARTLAPAGEAGMSLGDLVSDGVFERSVAAGREVLATGEVGTAYLCHPFLVHSAQAHRGKTPKFMAQPPLLPAEPLRLDGPSPVEAATRLALTQPAPSPPMQTAKRRRGDETCSEGFANGNALGPHDGMIGRPGRTDAPP